jgi:hypothetical protein
MLFLEQIFGSNKVGVTVPVYQIISKDRQNDVIAKGRHMHFAEGALVCDDLESIKQYYTYLNSGRIKRVTGISRLFISGLCRYSKAARQDLVVNEVQGVFIHAQPVNNNQSSGVWIIDTELIDSNNGKLTTYQ